MRNEKKCYNFYPWLRWKYFVKPITHCIIMWKNEKFTPTMKISRQSNSLVNYLGSKTFTFTKLLLAERSEANKCTLWQVGFGSWSNLPGFLSQSLILAIDYCIALPYFLSINCKVATYWIVWPGFLSLIVTWKVYYWSNLPWFLYHFKFKSLLLRFFAPFFVQHWKFKSLLLKLFAPIFVPHCKSKNLLVNLFVLILVPQV